MGRNGEHKRQRKGGKKVSPPRASSRQTAGMSNKKPHPPTPHTREGGNNRGVVREESTPLGPSEAGMQGPLRDKGWGKVATTGGVLPWQGKRKSQKVGLGLSRAEKRRRGKAKTLSPCTAKQRRVGGSLWGRRGGAAPPTGKATSPPTPANQGRQEQVEGTEESDSKVNYHNHQLL